ncbi:MAG: aminotransferase [Candidatus Puniceispirillales bacterium]
MAMFNPAITQLTAPPVAIVQNWINRYDGHCGPLIDLSQAVPGYPAHADLLAAMGTAGADPESLGYGAIEGEMALREAYAAHMAERYAASVSPEEVIITAGCNQAFITAAMAVAGAGDQVLMTRPAYFNHDSTLAMTGVQTGFVETRAEDGFIPSVDSITAAITPQTKALALVSPNNPTGAVYPSEQLEAIAACCRRHGIWLILDETYRDFLPPEAIPHQLLAGDARDRVILLYSFSKSYAIPGHRLGAITAPVEAVSQMTKIMDNIQICAPRAAQRALAPMIAALAPWRDENTARMAERARAFRSAFAGQNDWQIASMGAYFGYVRHPGKEGSLAMAEALVRQAGVLTIPGGFFGDGQDQFLRFAFANAETEAISQLPERLNLFT